ncbi:AAA family ATPase [Candidatus Acetothermia bacterium]|nr:AAA family ATPase [Candidatus Acetothermia bacterium]MBI3643278.1 AAA family ATPase [Candidatus Acetothermia bacterium]
MTIEMQLAKTEEVFQKLTRDIQKVIVGHQETIRGTLICLLCGGHALLEGVPGLGKTLTVKTLGKLLGLSFSRIQFTPDLMPADILGTNIIVEEGGRRAFEFSKGPIFAHIVLADEINRATPKTQSALLEAMQERGVTISGKTYVLDEPFIVLATQNPIEMEGTYPLPEAQVDRFFFKIVLDQPTQEELDEILKRHMTSPEVKHIAGSAISRETLVDAKKLMAQIPIAEPLRHYIVRLVNATHPKRDEAAPLVKEYVEYGASPRAGIALLWGAKANAFLDGQLNVRIEDIQRVFVPAFRHRIIRNFRGEAEGIAVDEILKQVIEKTPEV